MKYIFKIDNGWRVWKEFDDEGKVLYVSIKKNFDYPNIDI